MFLVKESYGDWSPTAGAKIPIDKGKNPKFWWNVTRWRYLIQEVAHGSLDSAFPEACDLREVKNGTYNLDDIAWVNIKKSLGVSKSSTTENNKYAERDKVFLQRQFQDIDPDIILCCGNFYAYKIIYGYSDEIVMASDRVYKHKDRIVIDFYHPGYWAYKGGERGLYAALWCCLNTVEARSLLRCT